MLTDEQKAAISNAGHTMLSACPGSGKTRVIISKLARVLDEVRGTPRSVACITYTNTAVYEIEARLRDQTSSADQENYDVCTIHSFCLNHIFRPFCHRVQGYEQGFKVLSPETEEFHHIVNTSAEEFNRLNLTFRDYEEYTQLRRDLDGRPVGIALNSGSLTTEMAESFWNRIQRSGYIDFANIIYYSYLLLRDNSDILNHISSKFAWILVDEFQDTTDLQVEILTLIESPKRTTFFLVGDVFQSIFSFAGARPDLANEFAERISARTDLILSGNFRSSQKVIDQANLLFIREPIMSALGPRANVDLEPIWIHGDTPFQVITEYFLPKLTEHGIPVGDAAILAPTWFSLFPLGRALREFGVSIVGPGARPYRRNRYFAPLAEQICGYLVEPKPDMYAKIERALFNTVLDCTGHSIFEIFSYQGRTVVFELLAKARELHDLHMSAIRWLETAAIEFSKILMKVGYFSVTEEHLFTLSVEEMKNDMRSNRVDVENLTVDDLGIYANPDRALKLSTLHNAKGREFRAVAMIDMHEGRIPFYMARTEAEFEEAKRLFYVGVTRAQELLVYVTDVTDHRNRPSRFLTPITTPFRIQ